MTSIPTVQPPITENDMNTMTHVAVVLLFPSPRPMFRYGTIQICGDNSPLHVSVDVKHPTRDETLFKISFVVKEGNDGEWIMGLDHSISIDCPTRFNKLIRVWFSSGKEKLVGDLSELAALQENIGRPQLFF